MERAGQLAVLVSGGLDSAILFAEATRTAEAVHPLYVRFGLAWEEVELAFLKRFVAAVGGPAVVVLEMPVRDVYEDHWSVTGEGVPGAETADEAVFLPGRNVLLLAKALLWCQVRGVPAVALGTLAANPFPDATPAFFREFGEVVSRAVGGAVRIECPYAGMSKVEVLKRGAGLPLEWTFSCLRPARGRHCGACNKCAERRRGFAAAAMPDPTEYETR